MNVRKLFVAFFANLVFAASALAAATPDQAKSMVERALAHIKAVGAERAYQDFNTPGTKFFEGELYIFAFDFDGNTKALGGNPKMAGKNLIDMKSADNKMIIKDFIELAKAKGDGWYEYKWMNPETKKIQDKNSYIKRVPGANAFLGCGFYK